MTILKNYKQVKTKDGSNTLYSNLFDETCHSEFGAIDETFHIYIEGTKVEKYCQEHNSVHILELGFGTGIGFQETYKLAKRYKDVEFFYYSLEIDSDLIKYAQETISCKILDKLAEINLGLSASEENFNLSIILGDARETIKKLPRNYFNIIYQDAFSPKKCPKLWTVEWFHELKKVSSKDVTLSTYSSSSAIRKSLIEADWKVESYKGFSGKKESTTAKLLGKTCQKMNEHLMRSPLQPIRDIELA